MGVCTEDPHISYTRHDWVRTQTQTTSLPDADQSLRTEITSTFLPDADHWEPTRGQVLKSFWLPEMFIWFKDNGYFFFLQNTSAVTKTRGLFICFLSFNFKASYSWNLTSTVKRTQIKQPWSILGLWFLYPCMFKKRERENQTCVLSFNKDHIKNSINRNISDLLTKASGVQEIKWRKTHLVKLLWFLYIVAGSRIV